MIKILLMLWISGWAGFAAYGFFSTGGMLGGIVCVFIVWLAIGQMNEPLERQAEEKKIDKEARERLERMTHDQKIEARMQHILKEQANG